MASDFLFLNPAPMPYLTECNLKRFGTFEYHCSRYCECFVLIFMLKNRLKFTENGRLTALDAGEWYIQMKNTWQSASLPSPNAEYYYLHFEADCADDMSSRIKLPLRGQFQPALFLPLLKRLHALYAQTPQNHFEMQSEFFRLLNLLYTHEKAYSSLTSSVMRFLNENYADRITAETLENRFHYSAEYINKRMKAETGITAHTWLSNVRMQKAIKMLVRSEKPIAEISQECGYSDASLFYKAFHRLHGQSPSQYRKERQIPFE